MATSVSFILAIDRVLPAAANSTLATFDATNNLGLLVLHNRSTGPITASLGFGAACSMASHGFWEPTLAGKETLTFDLTGTTLAAGNFFFGGASVASDITIKLSSKKLGS